MTDNTDSRLEKKLRRLGNVLFKNLLRTDTVCSPITLFGGTGGGEGQMIGDQGVPALVPVQTVKFLVQEAWTKG
jgi:hypothetical protein